MVLLRALLNLFKPMEKEWPCSSGDRWTCPYPIGGTCIWKTTVCKISQPEPSPEDKNKFRTTNLRPTTSKQSEFEQNPFWDWVHQTYKNVPVITGEGAAESSAALRWFQLFFYFLNNCTRRKKMFDKMLVASATAWCNRQAQVAKRNPTTIHTVTKPRPFLSVEILSFHIHSTFLPHLLGKMLKH